MPMHAVLFLHFSKGAMISCPSLNVNKVTGTTLSNLNFRNPCDTFSCANFFCINTLFQINDTLTDLNLSLRAKMAFISSLIHVSQKRICFEKRGPVHLTVRGIPAQDQVCGLYGRFKNSFEAEPL